MTNGSLGLSVSRDHPHLPAGLTALAAQPAVAPHLSAYVNIMQVRNTSHLILLLLNGFLTTEICYGREISCWPGEAGLLQRQRQQRHVQLPPQQVGRDVRECSLARHRVTMVCFSNTEGVGGDSPYNKAICPAGFAQFIDVCTVLTTPSPVDFQGKLSCVWCVWSPGITTSVCRSRDWLFLGGQHTARLQELVCQSGLHRLAAVPALPGVLLGGEVRGGPAVPRHD